MGTVLVYSIVSLVFLSVAHGGYPQDTRTPVTGLESPICGTSSPKEQCRPIQPATDLSQFKTPIPMDQNPRRRIVLAPKLSRWPYQFPWQRRKPGRERRPGGLSHEPTDRQPKKKRWPKRWLLSTRRVAAATYPFSTKLFKQLTKATSPRDMVISPYGIHLSLTMTSQGARGSTLRQLAKVLGLRKIRLRKGKNQYAYSYLGDYLSAILKRDVTIVRAVGLFAKPQMPMEMTFLQNISEIFGGDFRSLSREPVVDINSWVTESTQGDISTVVPPGTVSPRSEMVLASALCVKAKWRKPFDSTLTSPRTFYPTDGKEKTVNMMQQKLMLRSISKDGMTFIRVPMVPHKSMLDIIITTHTNDTTQSHQQSPSMNRLEFSTETDALLSKSRPAAITLLLPIIRIKNYDSDVVRLKGYLKKVGVKKAFRRKKADFSGISSTARLHLQEVFHRSVIEINERGIDCPHEGIDSPTDRRHSPQRRGKLPKEDDHDAAANRVISLDRPFVFAVREWKTGMFLQMGLYSGGEN